MQLGDLSAATVLEIGPGKGAITRLLASRAKHLVAVELDPSLAKGSRVNLRIGRGAPFKSSAKIS